MVTTLLCHFCLSEADARHTSGLFIIQGELKDLLSHLGQIFLVAVTEDDGLLAYVCQSCRGKAFSMEKEEEGSSKTGHERVMRSLVMDRIAENVPRLQLILQHYSCLSNLTESIQYNTAWLNTASFLELTAITCDDSSDLMICNHATQRRIQ